MDTDILIALNKLTAQRIGGILVLVDQLEQQIVAHNGKDDPLYAQLPLLRDRLTKIQDAAIRGDVRDEEWREARTLIDLLCRIANGEPETMH